MTEAVTLTPEAETTPAAPPAPPLAKVLGFAPVPLAQRGVAKADGIRHTHRARLIYIPDGYKLEGGETVRQGFSVVLQFGVRWHPERGEPHVLFHAWRALPMGDAIVFAGASALRWVPEAERTALEPIAGDHGTALATASPATWELVKALGLDVPTAPEAMASFALPCQLAGGGQ